MKRQHSQDNEPQRRPVAPALGVEAFAHRKGVVKAWQGYRERKERKRVQTARALRDYKKIMKREGYEAGKGASRKRIESETHEEEDEGVKCAAEPIPEAQQTDDTRRYKSNPFQKSIARAKQRDQERQQEHVKREENERERQQKIRERRKRTRLLQQKTRKGQPIMKNLVHDILTQLEKEK